MGKLLRRSGIIREKEVFRPLQEQAAEMVIAGEMDMKEAENVIYSVN